MAAEENRKTGEDAGEMKLGGNIALVGFESLDAAELVIFKKLVGTYVKKMNTHGGYKEMRLSLRQHTHGKTVKQEVSGLALFNEGRFESNVTDYNVYTAVSQVCEKILEELRHKVRKEDKHSLKKEE